MSLLEKKNHLLKSTIKKGYIIILWVFLNLNIALSLPPQRQSLFFDFPKSQCQNLHLISQICTITLLFCNIFKMVISFMVLFFSGWIWSKDLKKINYTRWIMYFCVSFELYSNKWLRFKLHSIRFPFEVKEEKCYFLQFLNDIMDYIYGWVHKEPGLVNGTSHAPTQSFPKIFMNN